MGARKLAAKVKDDVERRASRALQLCELGELSSARQALECAAVAPGTQRTRKLLTDEARRPSKPRQEMDGGSSRTGRAVQFGTPKNYSVC